MDPSSQIQSSLGTPPPSPFLEIDNRVTLFCYCTFFFQLIIYSINYFLIYNSFSIYQTMQTDEYRLVSKCMYCVQACDSVFRFTSNDSLLRFFFQVSNKPLFVVCFHLCWYLYIIKKVGAAYYASF